ncbi:hypothetical protein ASJ79_28135 [Mycobacterium sp. NAZ190054]|nr:hypothetical protein ASJ79_28135 [Mycobacterium sp. NAZ190054]
MTARDIQVTFDCGDPAGRGDQRGVEQFPARDERIDPRPQVGAEEPGVGGGEHRCEDSERVARQFVRVDRAERGGHHRHRGRGLAQVVEPDRVHPERREQVGDLRQFGRRADADRAVPFGGHPSQRAEAVRVGMRGDVGAVDGRADLDQRVIGGHLGAVHVRQSGGELGAQLPGFDELSHGPSDTVRP